MLKSIPLIFFAFIAIAAARPSLVTQSSVAYSSQFVKSVVTQHTVPLIKSVVTPVVQTSVVHSGHVTPIVQAAPVVHSAPLVHSTPVVQAAPVVQVAPVVQAAHVAPVVQAAHVAPVVKAAPLVHTSPLIHQSVASVPVIKTYAPAVGALKN
ncbi:uncharacterized protein ACRADG_003251 [Cochliomyia hominivorax]